jgi:hypothetical protein
MKVLSMLNYPSRQVLYWFLSMLSFWTAMAFFNLSAQPISRDIRSAFVYRLANLASWNNLTGSHFVIGILGDGNVSIPPDKAIGGKPVKIIDLRSAAEAINCNLVFIGDDQEKQVAGLLGTVKGRNVLTFSASEGFADKGSMINLIVADGKVQFEVNQTAIQTSGVQLNSQVFAVAKRVIKQ